MNKNELALIAKNQNSYVVAHQGNEIIISQVVPVGSKLKPVGQELRGKVQGHG